MPSALNNGSQLCSNAVRYCEPTVTVREAMESKWLVNIIDIEEPAFLVGDMGQARRDVYTICKGTFF